MKSPEQQVVDVFAKFAPQRFNHAEFARLLSEQDGNTQKGFFYCMRAYIAFKAGFASNFLNEIDPHSISAFAIQMNDLLKSYEDKIELDDGIPELNQLL